MDKTEQFAEAIYDTMENLHNDIIGGLLRKDTFNDINYEFIKNMYQSCNNSEKIYFEKFIKSILSDAFISLLSDFDGVRDTSENYRCEEIKIFCDNNKIDPWLSEIFLAIFQEKNLGME